MGTITYKAGMTHAIMVDDRENIPNYGKPLLQPATVLSSPPSYVFGVRVYGWRDGYRVVIGDLYNYSDERIFGRRPRSPPGVEDQARDIESLLDDAVGISSLVYSIPKDVGLPQKRPFIMEVGVGGADVRARFEYAVGLVGGSVGVEDVFKPGMFVDVAAITKGKGIQGPVKRFGVKRKQHKSRKTVRAVGTLGPWHPANVMYTVPMAGQMGFHQRVEYNKRILLMAREDERPVTPKGGFPHFGVVRGQYVLVSGSVPGPAKRPVLLRYPARRKMVPQKEPRISYLDSSPADTSKLTAGMY